MKEVTYYQCELCEGIYETKEECESCELSHKKELEIIDMKFDQRSSYGFPERIQVEIKEFSGCLAEYTRSKEGSCEEFQPFHRDVDDDYYG